VGLHIFGGKYLDDTSNYKEKLAFYTIEVGLFPSFHIFKALSIAVGLKLNYSPFVLHKSYGTSYQSDDNDRAWYRQNDSDMFKKISNNAGINVRYKKKGYTVAVEAWFGLRNLNNVTSTAVTRQLKITIGCCWDFH
jgi:hypothetical protein